MYNQVDTHVICFAHIFIYNKSTNEFLMLFIFWVKFLAGCACAFVICLRIARAPVYDIQFKFYIFILLYYCIPYIHIYVLLCAYLSILVYYIRLVQIIYKYKYIRRMRTTACASGNWHTVYMWYNAYILFTWCNSIVVGGLFSIWGECICGYLYKIRFNNK